MLPENTNFSNEKNDPNTKVCILCGDRHPVTKNKMIEGRWFLVMKCPVENVKFGAMTIDPDNLSFKDKHILK